MWFQLAKVRVTSSRATGITTSSSEQPDRRQYSNEQFGVFAAQLGHPLVK